MLRSSIVLLFSLFVFCSCANMESISGCESKIVVADKTGLDGCEILFKLENDEFLEPVEWEVEQPDMSSGEEYFINYETVEMATICMAGTPVRITCMSKVD